MFKISVQENFETARKVGVAKNKVEGEAIMVTCNIDAPKPQNKNFELDWKIREHFFIDKTTGSVMSRQEVLDNLNENIKSFNEFAKTNIPGATGGSVAKVESRSFIEKPANKKNGGIITLQYQTVIEYKGQKNVIYEAKIHDRG